VGFRKWRSNFEIMEDGWIWRGISSELSLWLKSTEGGDHVTPHDLGNTTITYSPPLHFCLGGEEKGYFFHR
jgi:hypothetical protein